MRIPHLCITPVFIIFAVTILILIFAGINHCNKQSLNVFRIKLVKQDKLLVLLAPVLSQRIPGPEMTKIFVIILTAGMLVHSKRMLLPECLLAESARKRKSFHMICLNVFCHPTFYFLFSTHFAHI